MEAASRVVVGLGNPGDRYTATRHNIGFRLVDALASMLGAGPEESGPGYRIRRARRDGIAYALVRPMTYMNRSGQAVIDCPESAVAGPGGHLIVIDDVALPFGAIRFRTGGSDGGHNGLASVLQELGTSAVPRLRLGVGIEEPPSDLAAFVLAPFTAEEEDALPPWLDRACLGVRTFFTEGAEAAMTRFNRTVV